MGSRAPNDRGLCDRRTAQCPSFSRRRGLQQALHHLREGEQHSIGANIHSSSLTCHLAIAHEKNRSHVVSKAPVIDARKGDGHQENYEPIDAIGVA